MDKEKSISKNIDILIKKIRSGGIEDIELVEELKELQAEISKVINKLIKRSVIIK